ncbi:MAG: AmmeMemoRadiSam system radical SAM enzyme [Proteobacteria bacterium]|nr:AmmeMemoRadiSam system radical SAM enzyme [Pseudomonadota bacterium]
MSTKTVRCELCFRFCRLRPGERGDCRVRYNLDGELVSLVYGRPCAVHVDPIEKKPLYHFLPGSRSFSIATAGCNGHCVFCQNWEISQANPEDVRSEEMPPAEVVRGAKRTGSKSISYTYTDPNIFYEYACDTSKIARGEGIKNVMVTAGLLNEKPLRRLAKYADAANVDLKGDAEFYRKYVMAELAPVQDYIRIALEEGMHLELTHLIVPTLNDSREDTERLIGWVLANCGPDVPLHFSRFFPMYKLANLYPTPIETLYDAARAAMRMGMRYVYVGNVPSSEFQNTRCPGCGETVVVRRGYQRPDVKLVDGRCPKCSHRIPGVWR